MTNLSEIPQNITVSMENNNLYDADSYYIIAGVDTTYSAEDVYAKPSKRVPVASQSLLRGTHCPADRNPWLHRDALLPDSRLRLQD